MKTIYAIRDRVANDLVGHQMYTLFAFRTDPQAVRYFADAILDKTSVLNKHPADYELIKLGELQENMSEDTLQGYPQPITIITGDALIAAQTPEA